VFAAARDTAEAQEARRQVARLALIAACAQYAVFSRDLAGVITSWNAAAEALYGYAATEANRTRRLDPGAAGREVRRRQSFKRMLRGHRGFGFETQRCTRTAASSTWRSRSPRSATLRATSRRSPSRS